jgi:hypothetical protein
VVVAVRRRDGEECGVKMVQYGTGYVSYVTQDGNEMGKVSYETYWVLPGGAGVIDKPHLQPCRRGGAAPSKLFVPLRHFPLHMPLHTLKKTPAPTFGFCFNTPDS